VQLSRKPNRLRTEDPKPKMPLGGLKWEDEEGSSHQFENRGAHVKVYHYVKHKHRHFRKLKRQHLPGVAGEIFSFLFAFLIAWLFIQGLGWILNTGTPLVVVESESMVHAGEWSSWHLDQGLSPSAYPFGGGMGIGEIVLVKGDEVKDIVVGDVIIYTKYDPRSIGGEPIIHRVVGIAEFSGGRVSETIGAVVYEDNLLKTPCSSDDGYTPREIGLMYNTNAISSIYPDINLESFRLFFTKGDNNAIEDQCKTGLISFPIHGDLVQGRAKFGIPYLGYVKLGLVCAYNAVRGDVCSCRCWWPATNPKCCRGDGS
jgi:signal peptidase I